MQEIQKNLHERYGIQYTEKSNNKNQQKGCEYLLKSIGLAGAAAAISAAFTYTMCKAILPCAETTDTLTLVALKVKLSN